MKKYVDFKTPLDAGGDTILKQLRINVDYTKGGMNYFSGGVSPRGVYVYLTPITRNERGFETSVLMGDTHFSGFKILLEELPRKNQKTIDKWDAKIALISEFITELYEQKEYSKINEIVKEPVFAQ